MIRDIIKAKTYINIHTQKHRPLVHSASRSGHQTPSQDTLIDILHNQLVQCLHQCMLCRKNVFLLYIKNI